MEKNNPKSPSRDDSPERRDSSEKPEKRVRCNCGYKRGWSDDKEECNYCGEWTCRLHRVPSHVGGYLCCDCDDAHATFTCSRCGQKGTSETITSCEKCEEYVCDRCLERVRCSYGRLRELCKSCKKKTEEKCKDCQSLKGDSNCWGHIHTRCEECDKPVCRACITPKIIRGIVKQICPKCIMKNKQKKKEKKEQTSVK
jgi:hypothetical protein